MNSKNISFISDNDLCCGCGGCIAGCPHGAIDFKIESGRNKAFVNDKCINCGLCKEICPSFNVEVSYNKNHLFNAIKEDNVYLAYSKNDEIRYKGASGGFITQFLCDLLDSGKIDGAIVAFSDGTIENTRGIVAHTKEEIISGTSSKYIPIPMCLALNKVEKGKKYAFVGKGCELKSLSLMQEKLKEYSQIVLKIGIMCHHTPSFDASKQLFYEKMETEYNKEDSRIFHRQGGWPGDFILAKNDTKAYVPYLDAWCNHLGRDISTRCDLCTESFSLTADILVGDAWYKNKSLEKRDDGFSLIIPYTQIGHEFLDYSQNIFIEKTKGENIKISQINLLKKNEQAIFAFGVMKLFNLKKINISFADKVRLLSIVKLALNSVYGPKVLWKNAKRVYKKFKRM